MALKKSLNKSVQRRCQRKPIKHQREGNSENCHGRLDDGVSEAYRKLGPSGYERYAKHLAQVYWNLPPPGGSGLLLETSKYRLRGGPTHIHDTELLTQGLPQPHYTLKVLKTAYNIFRLRMKKRSQGPKNNDNWFLSEDKDEEESKWAYILDRPLLEQYILLLRYIRSLASKIAWEMGHKEMICSATPLKVIEQLHPLQRLDFRQAKHYLPQPFVETSDSDTQLKIDRELDRLERAIRKREKEKRNCVEADRMLEEGDSSSSSTTTSSEEWDKEDVGRKKSNRDRKSWFSYHTNIFERQGEVYLSYKDPGSEESIFVDFADVEEQVLFKKPSLDLPESQDEQKDSESDVNDDDEETNKHQHALEDETSSKMKDGVADFYEEYSRNLEDGGSAQFPITSARLSSSVDPSTNGDPSTYTNDVNDNYNQPSTSSKPGSSSQTDDLENYGGGTDEDDSDILRILRLDIDNVANQIRSEGDICTVSITCHGDHDISRMRMKQTVNAPDTLPEELNEQETATIPNTQNVATAGGDASNMILATNEASIAILSESIESFQIFITNITNWAKKSNTQLDKMEKSIMNIESVIPKPNRKDWNEVKRHMRFIIKRYSKNSDEK